MNYSNGKPIGEDYSAGGKAGGNGKGYSHPEKCTIGMTFEELRKTWKIRKHKSGNGGKDIHSGRDNH